MVIYIKPTLQKQSKRYLVNYHMVIFLLTNIYIKGIIYRYTPTALFTTKAYTAVSGSNINKAEPK